MVENSFVWAWDEVLCALINALVLIIGIVHLIFNIIIKSITIVPLKDVKSLTNALANNKKRAHEFDNFLLKVNGKLDGLNAVVDLAILNEMLFAMDRTMLIGTDTIMATGNATPSPWWPPSASSTRCSPPPFKCRRAKAARR